MAKILFSKIIFHVIPRHLSTFCDLSSVVCRPSPVVFLLAFCESPIACFPQWSVVRGLSSVVRRPWSVVFLLAYCQLPIANSARDFSFVIFPSGPSSVVRGLSSCLLSGNPGI